MRKFLFVLMAIAFLATPVFAGLTETEHGPQIIVSCWVKQLETLEDGSLMSLVTGSSATFPGRTVTGCDTDFANGDIYGVYVGGRTITESTTEMVNGTWIPVQTYGYCDNIKLAGTQINTISLRAGNYVVGGGTTFEGDVTAVNKNGTTAAATTGNIVLWNDVVGGAGICQGWINGGK